MKQLKVLSNWFKSMSSGQQLFVVLLFIVLLWVLRNAIKGYVEGAKESIRNVSEEVALNNAGIKATYTESQYKTMAKALFDAMDGYGTDDPVIFSTFGKLKNDVDFVKLETAFGVREATDNLFGLMTPQDMSGWILDDLSEEQVTLLNRKLQQQGLTKRL